MRGKGGSRRMLLELLVRRSSKRGLGAKWAVKRKEGMLVANPRFVLRQWVLEELIKDMDDALGSGDEQGRREARRRLNGVLQVSRPPVHATLAEPSEAAQEREFGANQEGSTKQRDMKVAALMG